MLEASFPPPAPIGFPSHSFPLVFLSWSHLVAAYNYVAQAVLKLVKSSCLSLQSDDITGIESSQLAWWKTDLPWVSRLGEQTKQGPEETLMLAHLTTVD